MICIEDLCESNNCNITVSDENGEWIDTRLLHDGDEVILTYEPQPCKRFVGWRDCYGNKVEAEPFPELSEYSYKVPIMCGCDVTAVFEDIYITLVLDKNRPEAGEVSGAGRYKCGTPIDITAISHNGYTFVSWTTLGGTTISTDPNATITLYEDTIIVARFGEVEYTIDVDVNNPLWGTATGSGTYTYGQAILMTARPADECHYFMGWADNDSSNPDRPHVVTDNARFTAVFGAYRYTINTVPSPREGGSTSGDGAFECGSMVRLTAYPNEGYHFSYWANSNGALVSNEQYPTITVRGNATYVAVFERDRYIVTTIAVPAEGGCTSGDGTYDPQAPCMAIAAPNTAQGYEFVEWINRPDATGSSYSFNVNMNTTLRALFRKRVTRYNISVLSDITECEVELYVNGDRVPSPATCIDGDIVTVVATDCVDYVFTSWNDNVSGNTVSTNGTYQFTVHGDTSLIATHERAKCCIEITANYNVVGEDVEIQLRDGTTLYRGTNLLRVSFDDGGDKMFVVPGRVGCWRLKEVIEVEPDSDDCSDIYNERTS